MQDIKTSVSTFKTDVNKLHNDIGTTKTDIIQDITAKIDQRFEKIRGEFKVFCDETKVVINDLGLRVKRLEDKVSEPVKTEEIKYLIIKGQAAVDNETDKNLKAKIID